MEWVSLWGLALGGLSLWSEVKREACNRRKRAAGCHQRQKTDLAAGRNEEEVAERGGYSPQPVCYLIMFSPTCIKPERIVTISTVSHSATISTVPHKQHQFRAY